MEAQEHSRFALPNCSPSFSDLLIMCKIIGFSPLCSSRRGNWCHHLLITQRLSAVPKPGHINSCARPVTAALCGGGGSHSPSTTHAAARFALHGTHTEMVPHTKVSNHVCNRIILHSLNQSALAPPSIKPKDNGFDYLCENAGLTPTSLSVFLKLEYKTFSAILTIYPVLLTLHHQPLIKSPPLLQHLSSNLAVWELQVCLGSFSAHWPTYYHKNRHQ